MAKATAADRLVDYERRYRQLAEQLAEIGLISAGSVTRRYTRCGTAGCRCHADPPQPHGPYYQWTTKIKGKTVTRRLTEREATLNQDGAWVGAELVALLTGWVSSSPIRDQVRAPTHPRMLPPLRTPLREVRGRSSRPATGQ